jgi:hypothetical protein
MELSYDWKSFQSMFYAKRKLSAQVDSSLGPIYLVCENNIMISAFSEGQDLSDWIGATQDEVKAEFAHRELIFFEREKVDEWLSSAGDLIHFYDQIQHLRSKSKPNMISKSRSKNGDLLISQHFLLQSVQSWWQKLLPSTYGIYISKEGNAGSSLLLIIQRGRVGSFHVPDLSSMIPERRKHPADRVKYISERYLIPVQGVFVTSAEWEEWSESANPWPKILAALRSNRNKLTPFSWGLTWLISLRAYFGV